MNRTADEWAYRPGDRVAIWDGARESTHVVAPVSANSLMNQSKRDLAAQHERLVFSVMSLWCVNHLMADWKDPLSAVDQMAAEARATVRKTE